MGNEGFMLVDVVRLHMTAGKQFPTNSRVF